MNLDDCNLALSSAMCTIQIGGLLFNIIIPADTLLSASLACCSAACLLSASLAR